MSISEFKKVKANRQSLANRKLVCGFGVNDSWYKTSNIINGKKVKCNAYTAWRNMIKRCYSEAVHKIRPAYISVTVCSEWLTFSNFGKWFNENNITGYDLDKDIKVKGSNVYSPDTCLFVPRCINALLNDAGANRGKYPLGVSEAKNNKFQSFIRIDKKQIRLGYFKTVIEAENSYKKAKNAEILRKCEQYPEFAVYLKQYLYEVEV